MPPRDGASPAGETERASPTRRLNGELACTLIASNDRRISRRLSRWRLLRFLAVVLILVPLFSMQSSPAPARADDLSAALAQQQALARQIAAQKKQMAQLTATQSGIQGDIASTKASLANVSQNLNSTQKQIDSLRSRVATLQSQYQDTLKSLGSLETQLTSIEQQEAKKQQELAFRKDELAKRLVAAYQTSRSSGVPTVITCGLPASTAPLSPALRITLTGVSSAHKAVSARSAAFIAAIRGHKPSGPGKTAPDGIIRNGRDRPRPSEYLAGSPAKPGTNGPGA